MVFESVGEGRKRGVVDRDWRDGGREGVDAGLTGEDGDREAGFKKMIKDGWTEVSCGL